MSGQFGKPCLLAHIHLDRGRYASSLQYKPGFTHGSLTQSWMLGMPLLWTLKTSSAAPMRDKLIFTWLTSLHPSTRWIGAGRLGFGVVFRRVYFSYHARVKLRFKLACLRPPGLVAKRGPPGKDSGTITCRSGRCGGERHRDRRGEDFDQASRAPPCGTRSRSLVLGLRCDAGSGGLRGASHSHGTKPCLPLMCLGPRGSDGLQLGLPEGGAHIGRATMETRAAATLSMAFNHGLHFLPPSLCVSCRRSSLSLQTNEKMSDNAWAFSYRKSSGPLQKVHCAGGRGPGGNGFESRQK